MSVRDHPRAGTGNETESVTVNGIVIVSETATEISSPIGYAIAKVTVAAIGCATESGADLETVRLTDGMRGKA